MGKQLIIEDETPEFVEKLKTIKISLTKNLATEELLAEVGCKAWIDETGKWHLKPNKKSS